MDHLRPIGVVRHLDGDRLVFLQAQQGTGNLAIVGGGLQSVARRQIERDRRYVDLVIGRRRIPGDHWKRRSETGEAELDKVAPGDHRVNAFWSTL